MFWPVDPNLTQIVYKRVEFHFFLENWSKSTRSNLIGLDHEFDQAQPKSTRLHPYPEYNFIFQKPT